MTNGGSAARALIEELSQGPPSLKEACKHVADLGNIQISSSKLSTHERKVKISECIPRLFYNPVLRPTGGRPQAIYQKRYMLTVHTSKCIPSFSCRCLCGHGEQKVRYFGRFIFGKAIFVRISAFQRFFFGKEFGIWKK